MIETSASGDAAPARGEPDGPPWGPMPPCMISVGQFAAHPGNVREDLDLTDEFCSSVAEAGVRIPLLVTPHDDGGFLVIEGHRRLAAALRAGLAEVPCVLDSVRAGDQAGQFLDMVLANSDGHRRNFTPVEEAAALFAAHEAGANRTRIRKSTGRSAAQVKTALAAGGISGETRAAAGDLAGQLTLDQLALLAEFDGDPDAVERIVGALRHGVTVEYVAERIRQDRAEAAEHDRLRGELEAAGVTVTADLPDGAVRLTGLTHDGADQTPETHAGCPGRGAYFPTWNLLAAVYYCASPAEHGHVMRTVLPMPGPGSAGDDGAAGGLQLPGDPGENAVGSPDPDRSLVIDGNKAWAAAAEVRKRWLRQVLARRTAPREVARFVAEQLLAMPEPLRLGLAAAPIRSLFAEVAGQDAARALEGCGSYPAARLPLLMLAPLVVAYEGEMYGADASRRSTWRTDRFAPCPRADAGRYLVFLASLGYQLSVIEQAVADGVPYTGDTPAGPVPGQPADSIPGEGDGDGDSGEHDAPASAADADPGAPGDGSTEDAGDPGPAGDGLDRMGGTHPAAPGDVSAAPEAAGLKHSPPPP
jgi:ParB family transcriptional regulator, chromosome partitioning protein